MGLQLERSDEALDDSSNKTRAGLSDPSSAVYRQILDAVLEQRLPAGTKLGEEQLAEIFDVSRPVVRRALSQLSFERVVEIKPNRGAFIASPGMDDARQVFAARRAIEEAIVRACAANHGKKDIAKLRRHVEIELEAQRKGERVRWIRLTGEFHIEVARAAGNVILTGFLEELVAQTSLIIGLYGSGDRSHCCDTDHAQIVKAIAARDEREAINRMLHHLQACEGTLIVDIEQPVVDLSDILEGVSASKPGRKR